MFKLKMVAYIWITVYLRVCIVLCLYISFVCMDTLPLEYRYLSEASSTSVTIVSLQYDQTAGL